MDETAVITPTSEIVDPVEVIAETDVGTGVLEDVPASIAAAAVEVEPASDVEEEPKAETECAAARVIVTRKHARKLSDLPWHECVARAQEMPGAALYATEGFAVLRKEARRDGVVTCLEEQKW